MTISPEDKKRIWKATSYWLAGYAVIAGFMYYHSWVPLGPVLIAGMVTLAITVFNARKP